MSFEIGDDHLPGLSRLKEGIRLGDLVEHGTTEFVLDSSKSEEETLRDTRVDSVYEYQDYAEHINLDCIKLDPNDENPDVTPFDKFRREMTSIYGDGKVKKIVRRSGTGSEIPANGVVYVHYNSYLELEEVPFDSSYLRSNRPIRIKLGSGAVYPGFEISLVSMKKGEKSQFLIHPDLAFGRLGVPPRIPKNAEILVEIEMINFVDCGEALDDCVSKNIEDLTIFKEAYKKAKAFHVLGNDYFSHGNVSAAVDNYRKAENLLLGCRMNNDEEEEQNKKLLSKIYTNMSICYNDVKLNMPEKVCIAAREAHYTCKKLAESNPKLYFQWGKALLTLCEFSKARSKLSHALKLEPHNQEISHMIRLVLEKKAKYEQHEKIYFQKALGLKKPASDAESAPSESQKSGKKRKEFQHPLGVDLDELQDIMRENLMEFKKNTSARLDLSSGMMDYEREVCREVANELKLVYREELINGEICVTLLK